MLQRIQRGRSTRGRTASVAVMAVALVLSLAAASAADELSYYDWPTPEPDQTGEPTAVVRYAQPADQLAGQAEPPPLLELEQLLQAPVVVPALQQQVSTVSRQESTVGKSPAAVFVITQEMIRRSGFTTIPEVLRMVPGLQVAKIDSNKWSIGSRGLGQRFDGKLLVQIDGRSVYNPIFAGTYWDVQDLLLEDVERIEVVRGPGATIWGANAVNGVINIITKNAKDTQGTLVMSRGGTEELGTAGFRYGGSNGEDMHYRVWGKWFERDAGFNAMGIKADEVDDWRQGRGGFRMDWQTSCCDTMTLQGELFEGYSGRIDTRPMTAAPFTIRNAEDERSAGGYGLYRWRHELGERSDWTLQMYYDRFQRVSQNGFFAFDVHTYDVDFQHQFPLTEYQQVVWGLGYRVNNIFFQGSIRDGGFAIGPPVTDVNRGLFSAFAQDQVTLADDLLFVTLGAKLQHNDFTGVNVQPTARLLLTPSQRQSAWLAISRAVRTPGITDDNVEVGLTGGPPFPRVLPNRDLDNESLVAYELGYRAQPVDTFSWDVALFFNDYSNLVAFVPGVPFFDPRFGTTILPLTRQNSQTGETYGVELAANWQLTESWRLYGQYSFLQVQLHGAGSQAMEGQSPHNQVYLQSSWNLSRTWEFDLIGRYVDQLPGFATGNIPSYFELDARLAWKPRDFLELAVVGQNLLDNHHPENGANTLLLSPIVEVQRSVYGQITYEW